MYAPLCSLRHYSRGTRHRTPVSFGRSDKGFKSERAACYISTEARSFRPCAHVASGHVRGRNGLIHWPLGPAPIQFSGPQAQQSTSLPLRSPWERGSCCKQGTRGFLGAPLPAATRPMDTPACSSLSTFAPAIPTARDPVPSSPDLSPPRSPNSVSCI